MSDVEGETVLGPSSGTRSATQRALTHVLTNVFGLNNKSGLCLALQASGYVKIPSVISMNDATRQSLTYSVKDEHGKRVDKGLNLYEESLLQALKGFAVYKEAKLQRPLSPSDWITVTEDEFDTYQSSSHFIFFDPNRPAAGLPPAVATAVRQTTVSQVAPDVLAFKRGVKRDQSLFPTYKDEKEWDDWQRRTRAQATAQGVEPVLDPSYVPVLPQDQALFLEQNKYMMAVFTNTIQTDYGKGLIRKYEGTHDAQALFEELEFRAKSSTTAVIAASQLLSYITSTTLGKDTWNGTTMAFVMHWEEQVRLYESYVDVTSHFSAALKKTLLQNAVNGIEDLRQVKLNAEQMLQANGTTMSYEHYRALLISACTSYDAEWHKRVQRGPPHRRTVYHTDVAYDTGGDTPEFGFDTPLDVVSAYRTRMTGAQWHKLDPESQRIWDSLPDAAKEVILGGGGNAPRARPNRSEHRRPPRPPDRRMVQMHDSYPESNMGSDHDGVEYPDSLSPPDHDPESEPPAEDQYLAMATNRSKPPSPAALQQMMSTSRARGESSQQDTNRAVRSTRLVNTCDLTYFVSRHERKFGESLVDRGANGGLAGEDMRVITKSPHRAVHVEGIDNHQVRDVPIVTAGGVLKTKVGEVIGIFHQYAHINKGASIHSSVQLEAYKQDVNDRSLRTPGGLQRILTVDGYEIPLTIRNGLPYLQIRPHTDHEYDTLPHVIMTGDHDWDPSVLDCEPNESAQDLDSSHAQAIHENFNQYGEYLDRYVVTSTAINDPILEDQILPPTLMFRHEDIGNDDEQCQIQEENIIIAVEPKVKNDPVPNEELVQSPLMHKPRTVSKVEPDFVTLRPFFAYQPVEAIQHTWHNSTQFARIPMSTYLKRHFKSPFPAHNVNRRNEPLATDTVYSDTPAVDNGAVAAQFFVGTESMVCDVFPMKTDKQFVNTLEDIIRRRGAPTKLVSDHAQVETSKRVHDILRSLCIDDWQSEPYQQQQNPAERRYQTVKRVTNTLMDRTGAPAETWFLCMSYACFVLNHTACKAINWQIPMRVLTGVTPDISPILRFAFYQPVYYAVNEPAFPSDSREAHGRFVGIAEHVGHAMTFRILTGDTNKVIDRSLVRAVSPEAPNKRVDPEVENPTAFVKSKSDQRNADATNAPKLKLVDYSDLIGRSFLLDADSDGERPRARIQEVVDAVEDHEYSTYLEPGHVKFKVSVGDKYEDIMTYDQILSKLEQDMDSDIVWRFKRITSHEGPLTPKHRNYKGSTYNVMVEWENGEITSEPLSVIAADDPVTCAIYARENNLLDTEGWKRFKRLATRQKKLYRMANQAKLRSYNSTFPSVENAAVRKT